MTSRSETGGRETEIKLTADRLNEKQMSCFPPNIAERHTWSSNVTHHVENDEDTIHHQTQEGGNDSEADENNGRHKLERKGKIHYSKR
jgi:hypothetical protein